MKKSILVTGGAGFIGSHLCEELFNRGYRIICVDNLITGCAENLKGIIDKEDFTFISHDITKPLQIEDPLFAVLHFASPASPIDYLKFPVETLLTGSLGTWNLLNLAREKKALFMLASTSEVYGDPLVNPQPEEYWGNVNPVGPRGVYDEAKRFSEAMTMAYLRRYNLNTRIVRIFNTYGPRMREHDGRAVPTFILQALKNEPLTVFGNGEQTRSFCYISDLVRGILKLMEADYHLPMNIGNSQEMKVRELAELIIKLTGSKSDIIFKPLPEDDPKVRRPNISKARSILHWEPEISLEKGLKATIDYFRSRVTLRT
ncbi:MAG: SDR family oxidoreductase [Caldiserica bacterium]|nr:SDR family oxidoreductase [Caldisericota bacterium]